MGYRPTSVCIGYGSSNDYTWGVLVDLGFAHGMTKIPGRILPECASVAAGALLDPHYAHPWNRVLSGGLDFVEIPVCIDPDSRLWGGKQPQDLRVELVDAKNHSFTIAKAIKRQLDHATPLKIVAMLTHNIFDYSDRGNFRRQTLEGIIAHARRVAEQHEMPISGVTHAEFAAAYRAAVPFSDRLGSLPLDRSGYTF